MRSFEKQFDIKINKSMPVLLNCSSFFLNRQPVDKSVYSIITSRWQYIDIKIRLLKIRRNAINIIGSEAHYYLIYLLNCINSEYFNNYFFTDSI